MLNVLVAIATILPLALAVIVSWLSWTFVSRPWLLLVATIMGFYALMGFFIMRSFDGVGFKGANAGTVQAFGIIEKNLVLSIAVLIVLGAIVLIGVKWSYLKG